MQKLLFTLLLVFPCVAFPAALAVVPSGGAIFDATAGINPVAAPFTFTGTPANDAIQAAKSIPVQVTTPLGSGSGTVKTVGIFSKPVAISLGKALAKLALPVQIGSALYDAYQLANMPVVGGVPQVQPTGYAPADWIYSMTGSNSGSGTGYTLEAAFRSHNATQLNSGYSANCTATTCQLFHPCCGVMQTITTTGQPNGAYMVAIPHNLYVPPSLTPATPTQQDNAITAYGNVSGANGAKMATEAAAAGVPVPQIAVDTTQSPPVDIVTPWVETAKSTNAQGVSTVTEKQSLVTISPSGNLNDPMPVRYSENTKTTLGTYPPTIQNDLISSASPSGAVSTAPQTAAPQINFPTDYNRETTQQTMSNKLDVTAAPAIPDSMDKDIQDLTGDSGGIIPKLDRSKLNGAIPLPSSAGASCQPLTLHLGGSTFQADPCPMISYLHPLSNFMFSFIFAMLSFSALMKNDEVA